MIRKIHQIWKKVGMNLFWGDVFDSRFYVGYLISNKKVDVILDLGCGAGVLMYLTNASLKIGLEFQMESIKKAKKLDPKMELVQGDISHIPFRENCFNNILAIHAISSIPKKKDRLGVCSEIKRISSKNNTKMIFTAANLRSKHYRKKFPLDTRLSYLYYKELEDFFRNDFDIQIEGYNPFSNFLMFPLRKIILKIPENQMVDKLLFKFLRSRKFLKEGRSFVMICKSKNLKQRG